MSNHVTSTIRKRTLDLSFTEKALLLYLGDFASDDGSGVYASKATMALELETSDRTIQRTIKALISDGWITHVGARKHTNGFTFEYRIEIAKIEAMPENRRRRPPTVCRPDSLSPLTVCHPTPDSVSPQDPTVCHPNQIKPIKKPCAREDEAFEAQIASMEQSPSQAVRDQAAELRKRNGIPPLEN